MVYYFFRENKIYLGGIKMFKREIVFHEDKILTIQENGKIYVSIKHVCNGLGMTESQCKIKEIKSIMTTL